MAETLKELARAQEIYNYRSRQAREIKQAGRKVLGYFCCYPPLEIMSALDSSPMRILGDIVPSLLFLSIPLAREEYRMIDNICKRKEELWSEYVRMAVTSRDTG